MKQLNEKVIFLTGGSRGIGLECAKRYVDAGAYVVIVANEAISIAEAVSLLKERVTGILCDVSRPQEVEQAIRQTLDIYGRIDVIHNNAGIAHPSKTLDETEENECDQLFG